MADAFLPYGFTKHSLKLHTVHKYLCIYLNGLFNNYIYVHDKMAFLLIHLMLHGDVHVLNMIITAFIT